MCAVQPPDPDDQSEYDAEREHALHAEHRSHHIITHLIAQLLRALFY